MAAAISPWRSQLRSWRAEIPNWRRTSAREYSSFGATRAFYRVSRGRSLLYNKKYLRMIKRRAYDACMGAPRPEPVELHEHAMENLRYIRRTMERAGSFTAVPGIGGMLMGSTALVAAWVAGPAARSGRGWRSGWRTRLAAAIGVAASAGNRAAPGCRALRAGAKIRRRVHARHGGWRAVDGRAFRAWRTALLPGVVAAALWAGRRFGRLELRSASCPDGRLFHGGGRGGALLSPAAGQCASGGGVSADCTLCSVPSLR